MNRTLFAIIFIALAILIFVGMWWGWRARSKRDQHVAAALPSFTGSLLGEFSRIMYVSTTPVGSPLVRVAAPGLRYRGFSDIKVFTDGVEIIVAGENPVRLPVTAITGTSSARVRVGKAVERGGLTLLLWNEENNNYETTFRFENHDAEMKFVHVVDQLVAYATAGAGTDTSTQHTDFTHITQEDAR